MKRSISTCVLVLVLAAGAVADDAPPPRPVARKPVEPPKFADGKLTDTYWGVTYQLAGLEEKKGERKSGKIFDGKVGRVQIEVVVWEFADEISSKERRDADKKKWDAKKRATADWAQGDDPTPWATFTGEAPSGDKRLEGYAWAARGPRVFVVHAYAAPDVAGGADGVKNALMGLTVGPETGAAVLSQMIAKQHGLPWDDPGAQCDAASQYLQEEDKSGVPQLANVAEDLARRAIDGVPGTRFDGKWGSVVTFHQTLANAQMRLKKYDEALATLKRAEDLAPKTDSPGPTGAHLEYDVACCYSLMGRVDDAFASLGKAWSRAADWGPPVTDDDLKADKDLANCKKDPRWEKFLASKPVKKSD